MYKEGISAVLLAYGEADNLRHLLPRLKTNLQKTGEAFEIVVVDAKDPIDDSSAVCASFDVIYVNQEEPHFGGAFRTAIRYARYNKFLIMDEDGSHNPDVIPAIHRKFYEGYDLVIGSRYVKGGVTNDSKLSILMSRTLNFIFRICLGIKAHDISTDFRMYHTEQLIETETHCKHYDVLQEVLLQLKMRKPDMKIGEVPITFNKRLAGESKRQLIPFILSYIRSLFNLTLLRMAGTKKRQELYRNILLYLMFGLIAAGIDYFVFVLLISGSFANRAEIANIIGAVCGFVFTFSTNTFLNFKKNDRILQRLISYGSITILGLIVSTGAISLLKETMDLKILKVLVLVGIAAIQFALNRLITYRA